MAIAMDPSSLIPPRRPTVETLSATERRARKGLDPRVRITQKLIDDICAAIRSGAPLNFAYANAGIANSTVANWTRIATMAEIKKWDDRTQLERMCVKFKAAVRQAEGEAGLRIHSGIASLAGVTQTKPEETSVRRRIIGGQLDPETGKVTGGAVVETVVETRTKAPSLQALLAIGRYRFREEMGEEGLEEPDSGGVIIDARTLYDRAQQIRRDLETQGLEGAKVIDTTATSAPALPVVPPLPEDLR